MKAVGKRIDTSIRYFENGLIGMGLISISLMIFINVICRYFFGFTLIWAEELSRYIVVWITFIGVGACTRYGEHITIDVFVKKLPPILKKILFYFIQTITIIAALVITYIGMKSTQTLFLSGNRSATTGFPIWLIYISVPLGFSLLTYHCLRIIRKFQVE